MSEGAIACQKLKTPKNLSAAERFFFENAGYSYDPKVETEKQGRIRCANGLALAESEANLRNWSFEWETDDSGCIGCDCDNPECACSSGIEHETLGCVLKDENGEVLESLWGICEPSSNCRRVVEAELADQAYSRIAKGAGASTAPSLWLHSLSLMRRSR